jgi:hypothetical protein
MSKDFIFPIIQGPETPKKIIFLLPRNRDRGRKRKTKFTRRGDKKNGKRHGEGDGP